jgi:hypothetical protein
MRAYQNQRFIEGPDVGDVQSEGRASHIGKIAEKSGEFKPYTRNPENRRATRRTLKRRDKQRRLGANFYRA